eukprot:scaffold7356_cov249-Pinguiococcus_pyrenoidosus.AAC.6
MPRQRARSASTAFGPQVSKFYELKLDEKVDGKGWIFHLLSFDINKLLKLNLPNLVDAERAPQRVLSSRVSSKIRSLVARETQDV